MKNLVFEKGEKEISSMLRQNPSSTSGFLTKPFKSDDKHLARPGVPPRCSGPCNPLLLVRDCWTTSQTPLLQLGTESKLQTADTYGVL